MWPIKRFAGIAGCRLMPGSTPYRLKDGTLNAQMLSQLRLHLQAGLSYNEVDRALNISESNGQVKPKP